MQLLPLIRDSLWEGFVDIPSDFNLFTQKFIPEIYFREAVHSDIKESFRVIQKLLQHSFFEYQFFDIATLRSVITLEMALKIRYEEINSKRWKESKGLKELISYFFTGNYFEVYNSNYLDSLRTIRNHMVHPYHHGYGGPTSAPVIKNVIDIINGLYEDPHLRKSRMEKTISIIEVINTFDNGINIFSKKYKGMAHHAWPGFLFNKGNVEQLYFYYKPCFQYPLENFQENQCCVSPTELFIADSFIINQQCLILCDNQGDELIVSGIINEKQQLEFSLWVETYGRFTEPKGDYLFTNKGIVDPFRIHLREFHKM